MDMFINPVHQDEEMELLETQDPENKLAKLHKQMQGRYSWNTNESIAKEIQQKRLKLRDLIGLPIARGDSPYKNDKFYRFLVKRIVGWDNFGIFDKYDRVITEVPTELDLKISQVKGLIAELLNGELNQIQRFQRFDRFTREYQDFWGKEGKDEN